jgi:hypothetical protein
MSKLGLVGVTALSLALSLATPAFAGGLRGVRGDGMMHLGSGGFRSAQSSVSTAGAAHCAQRWAYYDAASGKYMGDDGEWRPCD